MPFAPTTIAAFVVAVSFAAGLNVYATMATLGLLARFHWIDLPAGLQSLSNAWVIGVACLLFAVEFIPDKVPGIDFFWNAAHTFIRVPIATLVAYKAASHLSLEAQLIASAAAALISAFSHSSKTAARILISTSPEPVSNIALSTTEDILAIGLSWMATRNPYAAAAVVLLLTCIFLLSLDWIFQCARRVWHRRPFWLRPQPDFPHEP